MTSEEKNIHVVTNNHEYSLKTKSVRGVASNTQAIYSSWAPLVKVSSQNHPECFSSDPKIPHIPTKEDQVGPKRWQTGGRKVADRWQKQDPFSGTYFCHLSATFLGTLGAQMHPDGPKIGSMAVEFEEKELQVIHIGQIVTCSAPTLV